MRTWIKFCGCTSFEDVALAVDAGADAFGMIFAPSPRKIAWDAATAIADNLEDAGIEPVAVFVNPSHDEVDAVRRLFPKAWLQFSGDESPEFVAAYGERTIKAVHVPPVTPNEPFVALHEPAVALSLSKGFPRARILLDTHVEGLAGGSGVRFDWKHAGAVVAERDVVIAGGLTPENVGDCVAQLRPFGVDVRSGIESGGAKDPRKMRAFVRAVRESERAHV